MRRGAEQRGGREGDARNERERREHFVSEREMRGSLGSPDARTDILASGEAVASSIMVIDVARGLARFQLRTRSRKDGL